MLYNVDIKQYRQITNSIFFSVEIFLLWYCMY